MYFQSRPIKNVHLITWLYFNFTSSVELCCTCYNAIIRNKIPSITYNYNNLNPGSMPIELTGLSHVDKRLISLINIFMSVILLPGGQYAEKGLILNLPAPIQDIVTKLPLNTESVSHVVVGFEKNGSNTHPVVGHSVCLPKIKNAWFGSSIIILYTLM